jgi:hypothetical protein
MKHAGLPTLMSPVKLSGASSQESQQMSLVTGLWQVPMNVTALQGLALTFQKQFSFLLQRIHKVF